MFTPPAVRDGQVLEGGLDPGVHLEDPAGVVAVHRHPWITSIDRDCGHAARQAQFQLAAAQRDGPASRRRVEGDGVGPAVVQGAADLGQDLVAQSIGQGGAVDDGDGLSQRQVGVAGVGRVSRTVDRQRGRGQPALQRLQAQPVP
jgi:hypothetical protein